MRSVMTDEVFDYQKVNVLKSFVLSKESCVLPPHHEFYFSHQIVHLMTLINPHAKQLVSFDDIKFKQITKSAINTGKVTIPFTIFENVGTLSFFYPKHDILHSMIPATLFIKPISSSIRFFHINEDEQKIFPSFVDNKGITLQLNLDNNFKLLDYNIEYILTEDPEVKVYTTYFDNLEFSLKYYFNATCLPVMKRFLFSSMSGDSKFIDLNLEEKFDDTEKAFQTIIPIAYLHPKEFFSIFSEFQAVERLNYDNIAEFDKQFKEAFINDIDYYKNQLDIVQMSLI